MSKHKLSTLDTSFLRLFSDLDDAALICPAQWAALCGQTRESIYSARARGLLPQPVIAKNRLVRWTAGQYREWARGLAAPVVQASGGRPRHPVEKVVGGVQ